MALPDYPNDILIAAAKLPPDEAIEFFRQKGFKITWDWRETLGAANNHVFQVAKSMSMGVLKDIRKMVDKALADGITFDQFRKELAPQLVRRGWWGSKIIDGKRVQLGSMHRLNTIYQTNTQSAYNAGRRDVQFRDAKRRPFLRLNEVLDGSTRASHRAVSGTIAAAGSKFWDRWYPPNGFNCRGRVQSLTQKQAEAAGGTSKLPAGDPDEGFAAPPGKFKPKKKDFPADLWAEGKKMKPLDL